MLDAMVGQFLKSGQGGELLKALEGQGLNAGQATQAVTATAEGAVQQLGGGSGGIAGMLGNLAGGSGGLAGMLGGLAGGGGDSLAKLTGPVAQFVAQKTGLSPAVSQTVVGMALPKLMELLGNKTGAPAAASPAAGLGDMAKKLGGLFG